MTRPQKDHTYLAKFFSESFKPAELAVWRFVRDQGGYWSAGEIAKGMHKAGATYRIGGLLGRLFAEEYLVRKMRGEVWVYGFTARCYAPAGESMAPATVTAALPMPALLVVSAGGGA